MEKVLVTGSSSWVALHIVSELIKNSFLVRCSLRNIDKSIEVQKILEKVCDISGKLEFCELDIFKDDKFDLATSDINYIVHTASPSPNKKYSYSSQLIDLTIDSTLRVLKYASKNGVKRVVLTSSLATISYGNNKDQKYFNENSWTNVTNPKLNTYIISRTLAEKKAWAFAEKNKNLELVTINPGFVIGPTLRKDLSGISIQKIKKILTKETFLVPNRYVNYIDVRELASMHVKALLLKSLRAKRFIAASNQPISFLKINKILKSNGYPVLTLAVPNFLIRIMGLFFKRYRQISYLLDVKINIDNSLTKSKLGWKERPVKESLIDMAKSIEINRKRK